VVILLINFKVLDGPFLGFIPILNGEYDDFTAFWYAKVGKTLCLTLFINIFSPHGGNLLWVGINLFKRFSDRGCSMAGARGEEEEQAGRTEEHREQCDVKGKALDHRLFNTKKDHPS